jgi:coenzyme Q-binding protein COQ10
MPTHAEQRVLPYTPRQLFDLVADIERYPEFLPWCVAARVTRREGNVLYGDLVIGFKMIRESFTSKVTLTPPVKDAKGLEQGGRVDVTYLKGPFHYLNNHWIFEPMPQGSCRIDFYIDFAFRSVVLQKLMGALFNEAVRRMVGAFEARAQRIYGANRVAEPRRA